MTFRDRAPTVPQADHEDLCWQAFLLGAYRADRPYEERLKFGLPELLAAVSSREAWDRAVESREEKLERQLAAERKALREQRGTLHKPAVDFGPVVDWLWEGNAA